MKAQENNRPGFLLYYETIDALSEYTEEETGQFIRAMADYARYGVVPELDDRGLRGLWKIVQPILSRDEASYQDRCQKNRYNSYVSAVKRKYQKEHPNKGEAVEGRDYFTFEEWVSQIDEANASDGKRSLPNASQLNENLTRTELNENLTRTELNENQNVNENPKGETGETRPVSLIREEWVSALQKHDMKKASELSNELYRNGYIADHLTLEIRKRDL